LQKIQQDTTISVINGHKVQYWQSNPSASKHLLMLRGFRSSNRGLVKFALEFEGYNVIIPSYPGYDATEELQERHTALAYAKFIRDFADFLKLSDVTLIGHSFGTLVGLIYATEYPGRVKNLVLIAPIPKPNTSVKASSLYFRIGQILPPPLDYKWLTSRLIQDPIRRYVIQSRHRDIKADIMDEGEQELRELKPKINTENFISVGEINPEAWLQKLNIPTLVIAGSKDRLTQLRDVLRTYTRPGIDLTVVPGMGHYAPSEIPGQLKTIIHTWLEKNE